MQKNNQAQPISTNFDKLREKLKSSYEDSTKPSSPSSPYEDSDSENSDNDS